jgi:hypothetical protein
MQTGKKEEHPRVYYVKGSGLFPVPAERLKEVERFKLEMRALQAERARALAGLRRV